MMYLVACVVGMVVGFKFADAQHKRDTQLRNQHMERMIAEMDAALQDQGKTHPTSVSQVTH